MDIKILEIASDTNNNKLLDTHTHISKLKNHLCGDEIQIKLLIKKNKIIDFGYQGDSCVYCQASASLLSKISINEKKIELMNYVMMQNLFLTEIIEFLRKNGQI